MRNIFLVTVLSFLASISYAQPEKGGKGGKRGKEEKVKVLKIGIFTEELGLTEKEAIKFWPLYNEYENEIHAINKQMRGKGKVDWASKSDKEIEALIEKRFLLQEQKLELERKYYKKFKTVLPIKKVAKISIAQRKFKMTVFRKSKEGHRKHRR